MILVLVVFSVALDGAFVVRIESNLLTSFTTGSAAFVNVAAGARGGGFFEEESEEFVGD